MCLKNIKDKSLQHITSISLSKTSGYKSPFSCCWYSFYFFYFFIFLGRILNRFSKDTSLLDDMLPFSFFNILQVNQSTINSTILYLFLSKYPKKGVWGVVSYFNKSSPGLSSGLSEISHVFLFWMSFSKC